MVVFLYICVYNIYYVLLEFLQIICYIICFHLISLWFQYFVKIVLFWYYPYGVHEHLLIYQNLSWEATCLERPHTLAERSYTSVSLNLSSKSVHLLWKKQNKAIWTVCVRWGQVGECCQEVFYSINFIFGGSPPSAPGMKWFNFERKSPWVNIVLRGPKFRATGNIYIIPGGGGFLSAHNS